MENKKILLLIFMSVFLFNFVSAEVMNVECARDDDCPNGYVCDTAGFSDTAYTCLQVDKYADGGNEPQQYYGSSDNGVMTGAIILGVAFIIGMIILGLILRKKRKD